MLVREAIGLGTIRLTPTSGKEARREAVALLRTALGLTRAQLYARLTAEVPPAALERYRVLLDRRQAHEPVSYLRGYKEFYGLEFRTDPRALIPRPETELLVELALAAARRRQPPWLEGGSHPRPPQSRREPARSPGVGGQGAISERDRRPLLTIVDVGTGCGCIAVALAAHLPAAHVYATDISPATLELAQENAARHDLDDRITFLHGDLLAPLPVPVDLIVANLPYVTTAELTGLPPDIAAYEPLIALDGGPDGLALIRRLLALAPAHLRPDGAVLLEIGWQQGQAVTALAYAHFPAAQITLHQDYGGRDRVVVVESHMGVSGRRRRGLA